MHAPYTPLIEIDGSEYFPQPYSAPNLTNTVRYGMVAMGVLASLSVLTSLALSGFIINRFITWKRHYRTFIGYNQYVFLVLNLLLADLQQSSAFLVQLHWFRKNEILAPSAACLTQGWLLHSGDVGSGFFVLAIAVHTFYTAVYGLRIGEKTFASIIVSIWIAVYFLTAIGLGQHGYHKYFTAAGAWCWVSPAYEVNRLWCHYVWIFIAEVGTIVMYFVTCAMLRRKTAKLLVDGEVPPNTPNAATIKTIGRIIKLMTLYPIAYIVLTLPLSAGRMWSMSHGSKPTSDLYSIFAGCLLSSCGSVDCLLYTLTRKQLLRDTMPGSRRFTGHTWIFSGSGASNKGITHNRTVTVEEAEQGEVDVFDMLGADNVTGGMRRLEGL